MNQNCGAENGAGDNNQNNIPPLPSESAKTKRPAYWLATFSILCCVIGIPVSIYLHGTFPGTVLDFLGRGLLAASPFLGISALMKKYLQNDSSKGIRRAIEPIILSGFILGFIFPAQLSLNKASDLARGVVCESNFRSLHLAIAAYADANNEMLPETEKWCDLLVADQELSTDVGLFVCPASEDKDGESSYALNKNVAGQNFFDLPPDIVLLFETKHKPENADRNFPFQSRGFAKCFKDDIGFDLNEDKKVYESRWNQVGGAELVNLENHEKGCPVLLANGKVEFVPKEKISKLRWTIEESQPATQPAVSEQPGKTRLVIKIIAISLVGLLVLLGWLVILRKYWVKRYFGESVLVGLLAFFVGGVFGWMSGILYPGQNIPIIGIAAGGTVGFFVGMCFIMIVANVPDEIKMHNNFRKYAGTLGMIAGAICSTIMHVILMIAYAAPSPLGIFAGLPYGIIAGAILGRICGSALRKPS